MYRIQSKNLRNDYVFAIALQQSNGFVGYDTLPFALSTLPPDCKIIQFDDNGLMWEYQDIVDFIVGQDVHVLNKEIVND